MAKPKVNVTFFIEPNGFPAAVITAAERKFTTKELAAIRGVVETSLHAVSVLRFCFYAARIVGSDIHVLSSDRKASVKEFDEPVEATLREHLDLQRVTHRKK